MYFGRLLDLSCLLQTIPFVSCLPSSIFKVTLFFFFNTKAEHMQKKRRKQENKDEGKK